MKLLNGEKMTYDLDYYYKVQNYFSLLNCEFYQENEGCPFTLYDHSTDKIYKNEEILEFLKAHKGELWNKTLNTYENLLSSIKEGL